MIFPKKIAIAVLCCYAVFIPMGVYLGYKYTGNTHMIYAAPAGTIVAKAVESAKMYFPTQVDVDALLLLVTSIEGANLTNSVCFRRLSEAMEHAIFAKPTNTFPLWMSVTGIQGYFINNTVPQYRLRMAGGANDSLTIMSLNVADGVRTKNAVSEVTAFIQQWTAAGCTDLASSLRLDFTNIVLVGDDLQSSILGDLVVIDSFSTPLAFLALCYCIRSIRFTIIPMMTVPSSLVLAFSVMYPISLLTPVSSFAPEMAMPVVVALSVDYCLFMLSRFAEQVILWRVERVRTDHSKWEIVKKTAQLTAHNVVLSGFTIAVALGALALIPVEMISSIGIAMSVGAVCAVFVAMTLMPSLLLVFFPFFSESNDFLVVQRLLVRVLPKCILRKFGYGEDSDESKNRLISTTTTNILDSELWKQNNSFWFKVGLFAFRRPYVTVLTVCVLGAPFFYFATELKVNFSVFAVTPRDSKHAATLRTIVDDIGHGSATPFYVTFTSSNSSNGVWSDARFFELMNKVTRDIVQRTGQPYNRILSPCMLPKPSGECTDGSCFISAFASEVSYTLSAEYRTLFNQTVSANQQAALISLFTVFDPFGTHAGAFLDAVNDAAESYANNDLGLQIGILGASAESWAIMRTAVRLFPYQILITFGVIFIFIAAVFRSFFIPFRMVFTVVYTVGLAYGLGVLLFQYDWSHTLWPAMDGVNSYTWTVPIFSFSLLCALALDYDVFLITRILEHKVQGYSDEAAIAKAVWKTGRIISFAGIIMFIAFGSLMFSNTTMFNQFGAVASFAVLIDTFIIRPVFGPALMSVFGKLAWWPRKFVPADYERDINDMAADLPQRYRGGAASWASGAALDALANGSMINV